MALTRAHTKQIWYKLAAVGAALRSLFDKLGDNISAKDFGAVGDGVANDQPAIQAAIDYLAGLPNGGRLHLPQGTYLLNASLDLKPGVFLQGAGEYATTLKASGNFTVVTALGSLGNVRNRGGMRDLCVRGSGKTNTSCHGINLAWVNRMQFTNVRIHATRFAFVFSNVWQVKIDNMSIDGTGADQSYIGLYGKEVDPTNQNNALIAHGIMVQDVEYVGFRLINFNGSKFTSCEAAGTMTHGWYLGDPTTGTEKVRWGHFINCLADSTVDHGWRLEKGAAASFEQVQFTNCWSGNSTTGSGWRIAGCSQLTITAPLVTSSNKSSMYLLQTTRCVISGANLTYFDQANTGNAGVALDNCQYITIGSSHIYTSSGTAKAIVESNGSDSNVAIGNSLNGGVTKTGAGSKYVRNVGVVAEKSGSAQIASGTTSVTVTHGVGFAPDANTIRITPRDGGAGAGWYSVQNVTATTFQIVSNSAPSGTTTIGWAIDLLN